MRKCKTLLREKNAYNSEQSFENHHIRFKESISPLMDITVEVTIRIWPKRNKTMGYSILFDISTSRQDGKMIICVHKKSLRSTKGLWMKGSRRQGRKPKQHMMHGACRASTRSIPLDVSVRKLPWPVPIRGPPSLVWAYIGWQQATSTNFASLLTAM